MPQGQRVGSIPIDGSDHLEEDTDSATVKSAKRVLQILELFKETRRPLCTTDIAMALNYPISSTAALLKSLATMGYLHFDRPTRTYQASLRVGLLGGWSYNNGLAPERINEVIEQLARQTGQTIIIGFRNENHIQYVSVVASTARVRYYLPVGSRQRLVDTPMGRALLSLDSDESIDRVVRRANADRTESQPRIDPIELRREIAGIRNAGYVYSPQGFFKGAGVVAVSLPVCSSEPPLVLGIGGPSNEIERDRAMLVDLALAAASAISAGQPAHERHAIAAAGLTEPMIA